MVRKAAGEYSKTKEEQLRFAFPSYHYEGNFSGKQVVELKGAYYELYNLFKIGFNAKYFN